MDEHEKNDCVADVGATHASPISRIDASRAEGAEGNVETIRATHASPLRPLPPGWRWVRLGEVVDCFAGAWGADAAFQGSIPVLVVGTSQITNDGMLDYTDAPTRFLMEAERSAICQTGDLLVVKSSGSAANIRSGKTAICPRALSGKIACANFLMRLVPRPQCVEPVLLWHYLNGPETKGFVQRIAGSSTYPNIKWSAFKNLPIPLPPLSEQKRIAAMLTEQMTAVDRARAAALARLEAAKALPAAFLRQVFPQPGRDLPPGWRWVRLGEVVREAQAGFACGKRDDKGIAQLRMNNIDTKGSFVWDNVLRVPVEGVNWEPFVLKPGDVLFNNTNSTELVGKSALFGGYVEPIVFSNHFTRLRTDNRALSPDFLASWLYHQWLQGVFAAICNRWIGQSAVKPDKLLALQIPLPPLSEQKRVAAVLTEQMTAVDRARAAAEAELETINRLPAALLRRAFNGEL